MKNSFLIACTLIAAVIFGSGCDAKKTCNKEKACKKSNLSMEELKAQDNTHMHALTYINSVADWKKPTAEMAEKAALVNNANALQAIHDAKKDDGKNELKKEVWAKDKWIIIYAARYGSEKLVKQLIGYGASIFDTVDINGQKQQIMVTAGNGSTMLHQAAAGGNIEMLKYLVAEYKKQNINISAKDRYGKTALDLAANDEVRDFLKKEFGK